MGKSDVESLPGKLEMAHKDLSTLLSESPQKDQDDCKNNNNGLVPGFELLTNQVAGHMHNGSTIGMLKQNGTILKPILKPFNGQIEIDFYEELQRTRDEALIELKEFVPKYFGTRTLSYKDKEVKCIVLEDLTKDFKEPCIIDIKIGRRTWDPVATFDKIVKEDKKYQDTKRELGICIPGFLVHNISTGRVCRYGKEYGKQLNSETIKDALKLFLNADSGVNRDLILHFLVELWRILRWIRRQRRVRIFSSSLLLIYDAKRLKQNSPNNNSNSPKITPIINNRNIRNNATLNRFNLYRPLSLMRLNDDCPCTGFSGQFTKDGLILNSKPKFTRTLTTNETDKNSKCPLKKEINKLRRVHSFQNNYDKDLQKLRNDYTNMLDDLVDEQSSEVWSAVKMIDFAHVFPSEHNEIDKNYLEGIENLIKIFEEFLGQTV